MEKIRTPITTYKINHFFDEIHIKDYNYNFNILTIDGDISPHPTSRPLRPDYFTFFFILRGALSLRLNANSIIAMPGSLVRVPKNMLSEFIKVEPGTLLRTLNFSEQHFSNSGVYQNAIEAFKILSAIDHPMVLLQPQEGQVIDSLMKSMEMQMSVTKMGRFESEYLKHTFLAFFYKMASIYDQNSELLIPDNDRYREILFKFLNLLSEHFIAYRNVSFYANKLNISCGYLSKILLRCLGKTALNLINEKIMDEAKILLLDHTLTVLDISVLLNFKDQFIFSKFFKKQTGLSPKKFQKSYYD